MKKITAILCIFALLFSLTACAQAKPEDTVNKFCNAMKTFDLETIKACTADSFEKGDLEEISGNGMPQQFEELLKTWAFAMEYTVGTAAIEEETAKVPVTFTYPDHSEAISKAFGSLFVALLMESLGGESSELTDEHFNEVFMQCIDEALAKETEAAPLTLETELDLVKVGKEWKISGAPENLFDVMTGNVLNAFKEIEQDLSLFIQEP